MTETAGYAVNFLSVLTMAVTLLPLSTSTHWAVRMWEFPRFQIICVGIVLLGIALTKGQQVMAVSLALCVVYQLTWIYPYTFLARPDVRIAQPNPELDISLLSANVEQGNSEFHLIADIIAREKPDVLFLMETDRTWIEALEPVLAGFQTVTTEPKDNYYGMVFATNLTARKVRYAYLSNDDTPALLAELEDREGNGFRFIGLHPRPPVPGTSTEDRDEQLKKTARFGRAADVPLVVMGDFNDPVWSRTSSKFARIGEYRDPRKGRGFVSSFHAGYWFLRFPIDHFFVSEMVDVSRFRRLENIGSDHFPLQAKVRVRSNDKK